MQHHAALSAWWGHALGDERTLPGVRNPPTSPRGASCSIATVSPLPSPLGTALFPLEHVKPERGEEEYGPLCELNTGHVLR